MAFMTTRIKVKDYDAWKSMFDTDPPEARKLALGHRLFRLIDDPNELMIVVEFETAEDAAAAREKLTESGVLERVTVVVAPALLDEVEAVAY